MVNRFIVSQGQSVTLFFKFGFGYVPPEDPILEIELDNHLIIDKTSYKLTSGKYHNVVKRQMSISFSMPDNITNKQLNSLGKFSVSIGGKQVYDDNLPDVQILEKNDYFEQVVVPHNLEKMGFHAHPIGGRDQPDTVVYHRHINTGELFDVESTIENPLDLNKFRNDKGKFETYQNSRKFSRLLIVSLSANIRSGVIDELNLGKHPHSLIIFEDLYNLRKEFEQKGNYNYVFSILSKTGVISFGKHNPDFKWLPPKLFKIPRDIV